MRKIMLTKIGVFVLVLPLLSSSARAQCTQWDVSGGWKIEVFSGARKGYVANTSFRQSGKNLSGKVTDSGSTTGTVKNGMSDGDTFNVYILWDGKSADGSNAEVYVGKIAPNGMIAGTALLIGDRTQNAEWSSDRSMKCIAGSLKTLPPGGYGAVTKVPGILTYTKPGQKPGTKTLSWDAGPDHPYAEVWVKVDDGEETFVVEQRKGKREITVENGKSYLYILTDSGKRLAAVVVNAP